MPLISSTQPCFWESGTEFGLIIISYTSSKSQPCCTGDVAQKGATEMPCQKEDGANFKLYTTSRCCLEDPTVSCMEPGQFNKKGGDSDSFRGNDERIRAMHSPLWTLRNV